MLYARYFAQNVPLTRLIEFAGNTELAGAWLIRNQVMVISQNPPVDSGKRVGTRRADDSQLV